MYFDDFKNHIVEISDNRTKFIKEKYIERFIDTKSTHYNKFIMAKKNYSDGE